MEKGAPRWLHHPIRDGMMMVKRLVACFAKALRERRRDRADRGLADRLMSRAAAGLNLDHRRHPWKTTIVRSRGKRFLECRVTVHRYDPLHLLASHVQGIVRGPAPADGMLDVALRTAMISRLQMLRRCLNLEERLVFAGCEADAPPGSIYCTDLITRRLLDSWGVDAGVFVIDAPHPVRSRRWTISPTAAASWHGDDALAIIPKESVALSPDFPPIVCDFDVDFLSTRSITLDGGVRVSPRGRSACASVFVPHLFPETILTAAVGRPFGFLVRHHDLRDPELKIRAAMTRVNGTEFEISDPIVSLIGNR